MAELIAPSQLAKTLGIRMQTIYGLVSRGKVTGHRSDGAKSVMVDPNEVKAALATSSGRSRQGVARGPKTKPTEMRRRKVVEGDIVSMPTRKGGKRVAQITRVARNEETHEPTLFWHSQGGGIYDPALLDQQLRKGWARIENAEDMLGMLIGQWVRDDKVELAVSLEAWMDKNGIEVKVPEIEDEVVSEGAGGVVVEDIEDED